MKKHIRILTPHVTPRPGKLDEVAGLERHDLEFSNVNLPAGPVSIESEFDAALAAPYVAGCALNAEREGVDAVMIDCMGDPGLAATREVVSIPVFGPAETSMHVASMLGRRFSIIATKDRRIPIFEQNARLYGVGDRFASARAIEIDVLGISEDTQDLLGKLTDSALKCIREDGADVIILGCTGFLGVSEAIGQRLQSMGYNVPVINPIRTTVMVAAGLLAVGLSHSQKAYPQPPDKPVLGYSLPHLNDRHHQLAAG